jgi:hypothetical protein
VKIDQIIRVRLTTQHTLSITFLATVYISQFCHQSLPFSGFMVLSRHLGTRRKQRLNHDDVSDLQVVTLKRGPSSRFTILSWMKVQNLFSQSYLIFPEFPVILNSLKSDFAVPS